MQGDPANAVLRPLVDDAVGMLIILVVLFGVLVLLLFFMWIFGLGRYRMTIRATSVKIGPSFWKKCKTPTETTWSIEAVS